MICLNNYLYVSVAYIPIKRVFPRTKHGCRYNEISNTNIWLNMLGFSFKNIQQHLQSFRNRFVHNVDICDIQNRINYSDIFHNLWVYCQNVNDHWSITGRNKKHPSGDLFCFGNGRYHPYHLGLFRWLSAGLQYLQCVSNYYIAVMHKVIDLTGSEQSYDRPVAPFTNRV